jgi:CheY-like chemotaxis protein
MTNSEILYLLIGIIIAVMVFVFQKIKINTLKHHRAELDSKSLEKDELMNYARESEKKAREEVVYINQSKYNLLTKLSHDIRTPMNGVIGMTSLLEETVMTGEQKDYVTSIRNCSSDLIHAINDILNAEGYKAKEVRRDEPVNAGAIKEDSISAGSNKLPENFAQQHPLKILVAEDDPMNQQLALMVLKRLGYGADIAANGKEVLDMVSEKNYDLIFMDVQMPEMDGLEATRMIRLCLSVQPVIIAMTANAMDGDREKCLQSGMNDYISKPVNFEELTQILHKWALQIDAAM